MSVMEATMHDGEPLNHIRLPQGWTSGTPKDKAMALAERYLVPRVRTKVATAPISLQSGSGGNKVDE